MLVSLSIRNVVIIEKLDLTFDHGLGVLTGETGAGKSILLDSLGFALGNRADARLLRPGAAQASVTAAFDIAPGPFIKDYNMGFYRFTRHDLQPHYCTSTRDGCNPFRIFLLVRKNMIVKRGIPVPPTHRFPIKSTTERL